MPKIEAESEGELPREPETVTEPVLVKHPETVTMGEPDGETLAENDGDPERVPLLL